VQSNTVLYSLVDQDLMQLDIGTLTEILIKNKGSDIHIVAGSKPAIRVDGKIRFLEEYDTLTPEDTQTLAYGIMLDKYKKVFKEKNAVDFSIGIHSLGRFRINVFRQRDSISMVLRYLSNEIKDITKLGLDMKVLELTKRGMGLVLVTGPTGSGKSTTLASMIQYILDNEPVHVITVEDPIEYLFKHSKGIVNQRELGQDVSNFHDALRSALREDPDVILVGEMRDRETIEMALRAAETGHLVFGTLHTNTAISTINRIVDVFSAEEKDQIRTQLSISLQGIISQRLLPKIGGGRVLAYELLIPNAGIRNLIKENKLPQAYALMQSGQAQTGMQTMNQHLRKLYGMGLITKEDALKYSPDPKELARLMGVAYEEI